MRVIADLHIHSRYSRACSRELTLETIDKWCAWKGITVVSAADVTHPLWFRELKEKFIEKEEGLYTLKQGGMETRFVLGTELSCIYSRGGKVRRVHILVFAPNLEAVEKINSYLGGVGTLGADGRPILGLDAEELVKRVLTINGDCFLVPAHAWTPWFSVFGSKSGFDSLEECFGEEAKHIFAIETGLSSDPSMNWRLSALDNVTLISNSDAHSPPNLGREANVFDIKELSYTSVREAIKRRDPKEFLFTVEFFPEEGKYHFDGHASCGVSFSPEETKKLKNICPQCGRTLTIGVLNRVDNLSDRERSDGEGKISFKSLVPLQEIIAASTRRGVGTKGVQDAYRKLIATIGTEFYILLEAPLSQLAGVAHPEVVEGIRRVREGNIKITPGYDGIYGKIEIFREHETSGKEQKQLL